MAESVSETAVVRTRTTRSSKVRRVQNFTLIWLDSNLDEFDPDFQHSLSQLRCIVTTIDTFTRVDQCLEFLNEIEKVKIFMIISGALGQSTLPLIHDRLELDSIYIFCGNKAKHEPWNKGWSKIQGVFTKIDSLCEWLKKDTEQCDRNSITFSVTTNDLNHLDPSFMYTQLIKEILIEIDYEGTAKKELAEFCRDLYRHDDKELKIIDQFERGYHKQTPIWWYTRDCFTYQLLNQALRTQDAGVLTKIGFFLCDVHRHIEQLHADSEHSDDDFIVYRGQGMFKSDFDQIQKCKGGLLAFNSFLSTSFDKEVSMDFARQALHKPQYVGILFRMTINPSISSTPFAKLDKVSYYRKQEKELLFSMHTVFRIGRIALIEDRLWQVDLILNNDTVDQALQQLTQSMREETSGRTGWHQLASLFLRTGNYDSAEEIYQNLLEKATLQTTEDDIAYFYHHLASIKHYQGKYPEALEFHQKSLEIYLKSLPPNHPHLAASYNNIGGVHDRMGEYSKALEFYQKSLEIYLKSLPPNHPDLANSYSNIGSVHVSMGEYSKALEFYQKSLEIKLKSLPPNHPSLATSYNNIGSVHDSMGKYSKALQSYQKSLEIYLKSLPPNHPDLATSYNNIGGVHYNMGEYSKALEFYRKALEIYLKSLPPNHPNLAASYNNIGGVHDRMGEYSKALEFHQKSLEIYLKSLPPNHPNLAASYSNIGEVLDHMGEYSKALEFHQKSLEIYLRSLPPNHPSLAATYRKFGMVYKNLGQYTRASDSYEKSLKIFEGPLSVNHPRLAFLYNEIGELHEAMGEHSQGLQFYEKALRIQQQCLSSNHPDLATTIHNFGSIEKNSGNYRKALEFYKRALEVRERVLPNMHPDMACTNNGIGEVHEKMGQYSKALPFLERAVEIAVHSLPHHHPHLQLYQQSLSRLRKRL